MEDYPRRVGGLDVNPVDDGYMIYQAEKDRVHYLNHTAVLVLELCTGRNSPSRIADLVRKTYGLSVAPEQEVHEVLVRMKDEALIQ